MGCASCSDPQSPGEVAKSGAVVYRAGAEPLPGAPAAPGRISPLQALAYVLSDPDAVRRIRSGAAEKAARFPHCPGALSAAVVWWALSAAGAPCPPWTPELHDFRTVLFTMTEGPQPADEPGIRPGDVYARPDGRVGLVAKVGDGFIAGVDDQDAEGAGGRPVRIPLAELAWWARLRGG